MFFIGTLCTALGMCRKYLSGERQWQALALTFIADHDANDNMKRYCSEERSSVSEELVKRKASERDMHTLFG
ncbi:hypothetical protein B0T26DRAFT_241227 [Lasiosphaeria miniovina]|uniref:Uncharacterized protein n=1 Tax=Lasiosphaeria miniovina TaxID=1954250 RepID=A0AA40E029_9PEZI|nr:uncharacterized protein B0T26DRAFT_241227 [Lasiosphaeria miniovina]KAK0722929.1 hypothetical protein B0T26DRAFT_241227 [Lasiosphaeria miniovina]